MPYFITHYADFKGRCARKNFWRFIVASQLLLSLLCLPAIIFVWSNLLNYEPMLQFAVDIFDHAEDAAFISQMIDEDLPVLMQAWLAELPQAFLSADSLTLISSGGLVVLGLFFIIPTYAMTACRMRDAGHSPYWALLPCMGLVSFALWLTPLSSICWVLDSLNLVGLILLCVFACQPSKSEN